MATGASADFRISNKLGLHARPASLFVKAASGFESQITVCRKDTAAEADGKSLLSLLMLAAPCGTEVTIHASGSDAEEALRMLGELIDGRFDEE